MTAVMTKQDALKAIRAKRDLLVLTQQEIAAKAKTSITTICNFENGLISATPRTARKLADTYGMDIDVIWAACPRSRHGRQARVAK